VLLTPRMHWKNPKPARNPENPGEWELLENERRAVGVRHRYDSGRISFVSTREGGSLTQQFREFALMISNYFVVVPILRFCTRCYILWWLGRATTTDVGHTNNTCP